MPALNRGNLPVYLTEYQVIQDLPHQVLAGLLEVLDQDVLHVRHVQWSMSSSDVENCADFN